MWKPTSPAIGELQLWTVQFAQQFCKINKSNPVYLHILPKKTEISLVNIHTRVHTYIHTHTYITYIQKHRLNVMAVAIDGCRRRAVAWTVVRRYWMIWQKRRGAGGPPYWAPTHREAMYFQARTKGRDTLEFPLRRSFVVHRHAEDSCCTHLWSHCIHRRRDTTSRSPSKKLLKSDLLLKETLLNCDKTYHKS